MTPQQFNVLRQQFKLLSEKLDQIVTQLTIIANQLLMNSPNPPNYTNKTPQPGYLICSMCGTSYPMYSTHVCNGRPVTTDLPRY